MKAYVTLLSTNNFIKGTLVLWQSLQNVKSQYPLVVVINPSINKMNRYLLEKKGITYYEMEQLTYPSGTANKMREDGWPEVSISNLSTVVDKFNIFKLTMYDKMVYLDSDMLVVKNIDYLFNKPNHSATQDCALVYQNYRDMVNMSFQKEYYENFNAGLLIFQPNIQDYNNLLQLMNESPDCDQGILRKYWSEWKTSPNLQLPLYTNVYTCYIPFYLNSNIYNLQDIEILHFIGVKPFQKTEIDLNTTIGLFDKLYWEITAQVLERKDGLTPILLENNIYEAPEGGYSYNFFKNFIKVYLQRNIPQNSMVLDVGCGRGIYAQLLRKFFIMDGIDIYPAHRNELTEYLYRNIFITDIRYFMYDWYDLIIMGDVLEHLTVGDGQKVITYAKEHSKFILVAIPYCLEQVFVEDNIAETHLQPDLTHEIFIERYPDFELIRKNEYYGYYFWKRD